MLALIRLKISRRPRRWTPFAKNFILSMVWGFWITISERQIFYWNMECRALYQYNNTIMWRDQTSTSDHPPRTCHGPSIGHGCRKRKRLYDIWMPSSISSRWTIIALSVRIHGCWKLKIPGLATKSRAMSLAKEDDCARDWRPFYAQFSPHIIRFHFSFRHFSCCSSKKTLIWPYMWPYYAHFQICPFWWW